MCCGEAISSVRFQYECPGNDEEGIVTRRLRVEEKRVGEGRRETDTENRIREEASLRNGVGL